MAVPIRRQIIESFVGDLSLRTGLYAITTAHGYQTDLRRVYAHGESTLKLHEYPAIRVVDRGDAATKHVGWNYYGKLLLELWAYLRSHETDERADELSSLWADLCQYVEVDETWGGLAEETIIQSGDLKQNDAGMPDAIMAAVVEIGYRTELNNPYHTVEE